MSQIKVPKFLTKEFFQTCLENGFQVKNIQIDDVKISEGSAAGDNYTSVIFRAEVKYRLQSSKNVENISLIVKNMETEPTKAVLDDMEAYEKEVRMYTEIMPKVEKLYNPAESFVPKCFYFRDHPPYKTIVLQDLRPFGYKVGDRVERLDETQAKLVLQKLGRFHAATLFLQQKEPKLFEKFNKGFYKPSCVNLDIFQTFFEGSLEQFIETVSSWNGFEKIAEKLQKNVKPNFKQKVWECFDDKPGGIRLLNHLDLWANNIMFKYDNGNVCDVRFIDLQISMIKSPGFDINYFFTTSVQTEVLKTKRDELIKFHYYDSFKKGLEELNYSNIPSLEDVQNEVKEIEFLGFLVSFATAPIMNLDRSDSNELSFDTLIEADSLSKKRAIAYSKEKFQNFMKYSLLRFDKLGLFD